MKTSAIKLQRGWVQARSHEGTCGGMSQIFLCFSKYCFVQKSIFKHL